MEPNPNQKAVLVVEDDALQLFDAVETIERAGLKVYAARDADEAISILEMHEDIGVVFTDINMPGSMDGIRLAHCVRDRWPPVQFIVTSGNVGVRPEDLPAGSLFFGKPYPGEKVVNALRSMASMPG